MTKQMFKTMVAGSLLGAALYFIPLFFIGKLFFFLFLGFLFIRFFSRRGYYRGPFAWQYADNIRNMNDEEYQAFKERYNGCMPKQQNNNPESKNKS